MGMYFFFFSSDGKSMAAKNPKAAAEEFIDQALMGLYKFKLKKVTAGKAKEAPDLSVVVTDSSSGKEYYFQYTSLKRK